VRTEGVYQVLKNIACLCDHIEAAGLKRWALDAYIGLGNASDLLLLAWANRVQGVAMLAVGSTSNLDKDKFIAVSCNDVELALFARVVGANDRVALRTQQSHGCLFCSVASCFPIRWDRFYSSVLAGAAAAGAAFLAFFLAFLRALPLSSGFAASVVTAALR